MIDTCVYIFSEQFIVILNTVPTQETLNLDTIHHTNQH